MAQINDIGNFNNRRQHLLKIKTLNDETILFTKEEAKRALIQYIDEELDFYASEITNNRKKELEEKINKKIDNMHIYMINHIDDRMNKTAEVISEAILNRKIEAEVNKRVEEKLNKIKNLL